MERNDGDTERTGATWTRKQTLRAAALVAAAYYVGAKVGLALTMHPHPVSTLWPSNAILLAALLLAPARIWWVLLLAAFPAHLAGELQSGIPVGMVLSWYVSNSTEALIGASLIRVIHDSPRLDSFRGVTAFLTFGVFVAPFLSSFLDAALVSWNRWGSAGYWAVWQTRLRSNVLAALVLVPMIVSTAVGGLAQLRTAPLRRYLEAGALATGLLVSCLVAFVGRDLGQRAAPAMLYVPLAFPLWAAVRFGLRGTSASLVAVSLFAIWSAIHRHEPFDSASPAVNAASVQLFLIVISVPVLILAAVTRERTRTEEERRRTELELNQQRAELAHLGRAALLGELSAALAHELNQPLAAIMANARAGQRLMRRTPPDLGEVREILEDIVRDDRRAGEVIHRLYALFKHGDLQLRPIDVNDVVREVLDLLHSELIRREVIVQSRLGPTLPSIQADRVQLQQVLMNLVLNACDAMSEQPRGERLATITTAAVDGGAIGLSVADRGAGIREDLLEKVFEPFVTSKEQGLGLGLAICRSIVSAHGGWLYAANNPDRGATFHLILQSGSAVIDQASIDPAFRPFAGRPPSVTVSAESAKSSQARA